MGALVDSLIGLKSLDTGRWSLWTLALSLILLYFRTKEKKQRYSDAPIATIDGRKDLSQAREQFRLGAEQMLSEGYSKFKGNPFYIPTPLGERLMIPTRYIEELKSAPMADVDFVGTFFEMLEGRYTQMGSRSTLHPRVARHQLNQNLDNIADAIYDEIKTSFDSLIPSTDDWSTVNLSEQMLQTVGRASSRMFGGVDLSRNQKWVDATINFAIDGFLGSQKIKKFPALLKPLAAPFIPELRRISNHYRTAREVIVPILKARETTGETPCDFLQWMTDDAQAGEQDNDFKAEILLKLSFAAIHTSASTPMQLMYDLCANPAYIEPLRKEIEEAVPQHRTRISKHDLPKLPKLDSIMKESLRFNPLLLITFERVITKDLYLSDGYHIPAGTQIGYPAQAASMDPVLYDDSYKFDGFRFLQKPTETSSKGPKNAQWSSSNLQNMAFGYGRHACPGRHFAELEIKLIIVHLLMNYDFKLSSDSDQTRPENLRAETQVLPNPQTNLLMRKRRV